jgi:ABC-2 type transport system ATP-binding protein
LSARELVSLHARLAGVAVTRIAGRVDDVLELVGLAPHRDRRVRTFSKGMLQRVGLAQAIVHQPDVIFLDEPTSGLDPIGRRMVRDILRAERERGATVFLNSHLLGEIEVTCDRVAFIRDGEVVATQDLGVEERRATRVRIRVDGLSSDAYMSLEQFSTSIVREEGNVILALESRDTLPAVIRHLVDARAEIYEVVPQREPLEDLFVRIMGEDRGL